MELIKADDDVHVQFFWAIVSVEWEEEESRALLEQNNWTLCYYSLASGWLEKYKKTLKKTTQKSKGVWKQVSSSSKSVAEEDL